jgi:hypothetical protein
MHYLYLFKKFILSTSVITKCSGLYVGGQRVFLSSSIIDGIGDDKSSLFSSRSNTRPHVVLHVLKNWISMD